MKEVIALIRPEKWPETRAVITDLEVEAIAHHRVLGRGRQRGLRYLRRAVDGGEGDMPFLPKRFVSCLVQDEAVASVVSAIIRVNQTGNVGDGKVFVRALDLLPAAPAASAAAVTV